MDRQGLLTWDMPELSAAQHRYARDPEEVSGWPGHLADGISLAYVVTQVRPTVLIGTSARPGAFTEAVVRETAAHTERPVILPMSNPTALSEAVPRDLIAWTDGRALVATGSPLVLSTTVAAL